MIEQTLLFVDFGMMLLIWIVQLIIYPSFRYYDLKRLKSWHGQYMFRITIFVLPLMSLQLFGHIWLLWNGTELHDAIIAVLIFLAWLITFLIEVPYHNRISQNNDVTLNIERLIKWNWPRTALWTAIFIIHLIS